MKLRPVAGIVLRQIYLLRGSPVRLFPMVTWVAIDIVLWGFITRYLNSVSGSGVNFVPTLLGGVLLWDFCTRIMQGVTHGVPRGRLVAQFSQSVRLAAVDLRIHRGPGAHQRHDELPWGSSSCWCSRPWCSVWQFFVFGLPLAAFLRCCSCSASRWASSPAPWCCASGRPPNGCCGRCPPCCPRSPPCSIRCPRCRPGCSGWRIALPPSYVFEGMRALSPAGRSQGHQLAQGALLAVVELLLAAYFYARVYRHAVRTGLLARYSAEGAA